MNHGRSEITEGPTGSIFGEIFGKRPVSWNQTLTVRIGTTVVARCCSFKATPLNKGPRCTVHKGKLIGPGHEEKADVVVKAFYGQHPDISEKRVAAEMKKWSFAQNVLRQCSKATQDRLTLTRTFQSVVDEVGKGSWLRSKIMHKPRLNHHIKEGNSLLIQDFVLGHFQTMFDISTPELQNQTSDTPGQQCLLELMHNSFVMSGGSCVISAANGVAVPGANKNGTNTFQLTSLTIHSKDMKFGEKDLGVLGLDMYGQWRSVGVCPQNPLMPSAPPPDILSDNIEFSHVQNLLRPTAPPVEILTDYTESSQAQESQHACVWPPSTARQIVTRESSTSSVTSTLPGLHAFSELRDALATHPELRMHWPERLLTLILGPAPPYAS